MPRPAAMSAPAAPESPSCRAATRKPNASNCWPPAWGFLTSIRTSVSMSPRNWASASSIRSNLSASSSCPATGEVGVCLPSPEHPVIDAYSVAVNRATAKKGKMVRFLLCQVLIRGSLSL